MSRSFKKNPIMNIGKTNYKEHRHAKKNMTRQARRRINQDDELPSGAYYKKWYYDWRWRPDDGRSRCGNGDPKVYRK